MKKQCDIAKVVDSIYDNQKIAKYLYACRVGGHAGQCANVSVAIFPFVKKKCPNARLKLLSDFVGELPKDAIASSALEHWIIVIDKTVVDLTGDQFGSEFSDTVSPLSKYSKRWRRMENVSPELLTEVKQFIKQQHSR